MNTTTSCQNCGDPLPPALGYTARRWCSEKCRKAAFRRRPKPERPPVIPPVDPGTPGTLAAVERLVARMAPDTEEAAAQAALAIDLARMVEHGSVAAAQQLRPLLLEMRAARDPGSDPMPTQAMFDVISAQLYSGPDHDGGRDLPPGWRSTELDGEILLWLGRRLRELREAGDQQGLDDLDRWCGAHAGEIHEIRRSGLWSVWPDDRNSL